MPSVPFGNDQRRQRQKNVFNLKTSGSQRNFISFTLKKTPTFRLNFNTLKNSLPKK